MRFVVEGDIMVKTVIKGGRVLFQSFFFVLFLFLFCQRYIQFYVGYNVISTTVHHSVIN